MMKRLKISAKNVVNVAAVLVTIASLSAAACWITSGRAGSEADDRKTAALGFMMLRLEAATEASTARVEQQTYFTQAAMYYAYADAATDENVRNYLISLGDNSYEFSENKGAAAENAENRAQTYYDAYEKAIESATMYGRAAGDKSTGALVFNISAIVASVAVIFRRKEILYVYAPIFAIGVFYFIVSIL